MWRRHSEQPAAAAVLLASGIRLLSPDARDALARIGTGGEQGWRELSSGLDAGLVAEAAAGGLPEGWDPRALLGAVFLSNAIAESTRATAASAGAGAPGDAQSPAPELRRAAAMIRACLDDPRFALLLRDREPRLHAIQLAWLSGDRQLLKRVVAAAPPTVDRWNGSAAWSVRVDALRPRSFTAEQGEAIEAWWLALNEPLAELGLEDWELQFAGEEPVASVFELIRAPRVRSCEVPEAEQPLVSIIVPSYCPGPEFPRTIESLTRQSWRNLEILIIDDASPEGSELIARAAASDPRIRAIRLEENGGAYRARNAGLELARGAFVTVVDSDDLSHPRKIERQMLPLLRRPALMATMGVSIRIFEDGSLTSLGEYPISHHPASLLYRREAVIAALGGYDEVRKAADMEFIDRLALHFGEGSMHRISEPLDLYQLSTGSLSRRDFRAGWFSGDRVAYRHQWTGWHRYLLATGADAVLRIRSGERPFAAPPAFLGLPAPESLPFACLADWSVPGHDRLAAGMRPSAIAETLAATVSAEPVGLLHAADPAADGTERDFLTPRQLWDLVERGDACWISWEQRLHIGTLVVPSADALALLPEPLAVGVGVERLIVLGEAEEEAGAPGLQQRCLRTFGIPAEWVSPEALAQLSPR